MIGMHELPWDDFSQSDPAFAISYLTDILRAEERHLVEVAAKIAHIKTLIEQQEVLL